jgi:hypothetical protein
LGSKHVQRLRWALGLLGVVAVALVAYTGYQALQARDDLEDVAAQFEKISHDLAVGDEQAATRHLRAARVAAEQAQRGTRGPGWWLTSRLPEVGDDVEAVRTVADVTETLAAEVIPDVVMAGDKLDAGRLRPRNGRIAIEPLAEVAATVVAADERMQRQQARVAAIDTTQLNVELAQPVELMQDKLADAASLSSKASYAVRLLPTMLGADGPRDYLVLFQNNAEVRATGGIPGAWAIMSAENGRITLGEQGSASAIGRLAEPPLPLTGEELALYGEKMGLFPQNINFTPDFPRTAELARAMWDQELGTTVDGVVSVDPVVLSYLLEATGPVDLPGGKQLTGENAVPLLLNEIYDRLPDPARQDAFFAAATDAVFEKVASGAGEPDEVLAALARGVSEGRIYAWSAHQPEQALLADTTLGGVLPRAPGETRPFLGVFLNDGTGAKMEYFLEHRVDVEPVACNAEGRQQLEISFTLRSTAPDDPGRLPEYVVGMAEELGVRPGTMRVNVHVYAPAGGWIDGTAVDGSDVPISEVDHLGHAVGSRSIEIAPGAERVLTYTVMTGLDQPGEVDVRVTPGVRGDGLGSVGSSACTAS